MMSIRRRAARSAVAPFLADAPAIGVPARGDSAGPEEGTTLHWGRRQ